MLSRFGFLNKSCWSKHFHHLFTSFRPLSLFALQSFQDFSSFFIQFTSCSRNAVILYHLPKMENSNKSYREALTGRKDPSHVAERELASLSSPNFDLRYLYIAQMPVLYNDVVLSKSSEKYDISLTFCHLCNIYIGIGKPYIELPCSHQFHLRYVHKKSANVISSLSVTEERSISYLLTKSWIILLMYL